MRTTSKLIILICALILPVAVLAAWRDAPAGPPNYGAVSPDTQADYKPMNLGSVSQTKSGGANFATDDAAKVGIGGIPIGTAKLSVGGESTGDTVAIYTNSTNTGNSALYLEQSNSAGYAIYASGGMNYFSGNVGIGTTAPGYKLDVQGGQINASGGLCMAGNCKTSWAEVVSGGITGSGTANTIPLWSSGSALTDSIMTQNGLGDNITVAGSITASAFRDSENSNYYINPAGTTSALLAGNVGIGTTAPGYKLDVTGSVNATGGLYWNGNPVARSGDNISIFTNDSGYITDGNTGWNNSYGYITSESDPQVGALTSNKWCTSDGSQVNCTSDTPSAGVTSINSKTGAVNIIAGTGGITVDNTISNTIKISSTFSESDTLDSVTDRGNSTYNPIIVSRMYDYQNTYYEVNPAYISYMNKIQLNDTLNILAPVDTDGNWIWTSTANASNSGDGWVYATQNVSLDSVRPILGIRISGYSDDGGTCVAVVVNYFAGGITNNAEFDDLDLFNGGQITATYDSTGNGNMITRNFIFDQLVSGRDLGGQLYYQDNYAHNKSAGLNYIPPNKTLYLYGTAYGDPGSESINCSVDVLYGNI